MEVSCAERLPFHRLTPRSQKDTPHEGLDTMSSYLEGEGNRIDKKKGEMDRKVFSAQSGSHWTFLDSIPFTLHVRHVTFNITDIPRPEIEYLIEEHAPRQEIQLLKSHNLS